ncbi:MAG: HAD family hydrolase [Promethearchaeota archaeon]
MDSLDISNYRGIIFDLDGVIFDIADCIKQAVEDAIEKYKIETNTDNVLQEIAHLIEDIQHYPVPKIILQSYELLKDVEFLNGLTYFKKLRVSVYLFNQFNKYKENAGIFDGINSIIEYLYRKNLKLAILTNNKSNYAEEILKKFNLDKYFELIIGFNDVDEVKPSPDGINKILKKWEISPSEAIFIGDMTTDILAGKAANVYMICVASGLAQKDSLLELNPDSLVDNIQELKKLLNVNKS